MSVYVAELSLESMSETVTPHPGQLSVSVDRSGRDTAVIKVTHCLDLSSLRDTPNVCASKNLSRCRRQAYDFFFFYYFIFHSTAICIKVTPDLMVHWRHVSYGFFPMET